MRNFRTMKMWNDALALAVETYNHTRQFPVEEKFGLASQMNRASISVSSNIAEGCSRNSDMEFKRFLEMAMGSLFELETQYVLACKLSFVNDDSMTLVFEQIHQLQKQINGLINKIKSDNKKPLTVNG